MKLRLHSQLAGLVLSIGCILQVMPAHAAVTSVDGTLTNGQTITINGSGFGSKSHGPPLYYWNFGGNTTSLMTMSMSSYTGAIQGTLSTSVVAPGSTTALRSDVGGVTDAMAMTSGVKFSSNRLYVWLKKNYAFSITSSAGSSGFNLKFFRLWQDWVHDIIISYEGSMGLDSGRTYPEFTGASATWFKMPQESNKWLVEEFEYANGTVNNTDGVLNYTRNGISAYPRTSRFLVTTSGYPNAYNTLYLDQVSNNTIAPGTYIYYDSVYVDDSLQRVVISSEPTWQSVVYGSGGTERAREVQIPVTWSDTRITATVRQGGLGSLSSRYLYVIGADGNPINTTGFPLTGGTVKTPNPPTAVSVQ